jgi:hypothetical protein
MTTDERLGILRREIVRWNQQISLVSRTRPRKTVDSLVAQCRRAWTLVGGHLEERGWPEARCWIDIGSGAGLPGLVWAAEDAAGGDESPFVLVEPRQKRAWFLNRAARAMGLLGVVVVESRWGQQEQPLVVGDARCAVLSFKALRMGDREALDGLARVPGLGGLERVAIVRFLGVDDREGEALIDHFVSSDPGQDPAWQFDGGEFLGTGDPRLMVVHYHRT